MADRITDEKRLVLAQIDDAVRSADKNCCPCFVGFLSEPQSSAVKEYIRSADFYARFPNARYSFFGGYDNAERLIFAALPDWAESGQDIAYPIAALRFSHRAGFNLRHSDYLGSLMSLGLERDRVGDIIVDENGAYVFVFEQNADYIISQTEKIGRVGVTVTRADIDHIDIEPSFETVRKTIASERIDCVIGALCNISRENASQKIADKLVYLNGIAVGSASKRVREGDTVTVRRVGKFIIRSIDARTKKGRIVLVADKKI